MTIIRAALCCLSLAAALTPAAPPTLAARLAWKTAPSAPASGIWQALPDMPTARAQPVAVADTTTEKLYVLGGYVEERGAPLDTVEIYDPATNQWSPGPSLPVATRGAAAVYLDGKIYVIGGVGVEGPPPIQVLDVKAGTWTTAEFADSAWEAGAAVLGGKIYLAGGEYHETQLFEVDPATLAATPKADIPEAHRLFDLAAVGGSLFAVAGVDTGISAHASVESYDPATDEWSADAVDLPEARSSYASGVIGDRLYVAGGSTILFNGQPPRFDTLFVYDAATGEWTTGPSMPDYVRELAGATLGSSLYVFGGWAGSGASASVYRFAVGSGPGPAIACPPNVTAAASQGGLCAMSAVVTYPAPTVPPGVLVTCSPASGSSFPAGTSTVTCTAVDASGNASTCGFAVTVTAPATTCAVDDVSGDAFREVVDRTSPLYGAWSYTAVATGETFCGIANRVAYRPGLSLTSSDTDDPRYTMSVQLSYATKTGSASVTDRSTGRRFVLRDRNLGDSVCR